MPHQPLSLNDTSIDSFEAHNSLFAIKTERPLKAKLVIDKNLPLHLAQGLFARPGTHDVIVHLGSGPSKCTCDAGLSEMPGMTITSAENNVFKLAASVPSPTPAHTCSHPMDEVYFSLAPVLYGEHIANFCLIPSSPGLIALKNHPFSPDTPNALHEATIAFFQYNQAEFTFSVQLEEGSQYHAVARLIIPALEVCDASMEALAESLALPPLHILAA